MSGSVILESSNGQNVEYGSHLISASEGAFSFTSTAGAVVGRGLSGGMANSKRYCEVLAGASKSGSPRLAPGITYVSRGAYIAMTGAICYRSDGVLLRNYSSQAGTYATFTTNDVLGFAYDPALGKVWVAKNGTWQNSSNPATGTGGVAFAEGLAIDWAWAMPLLTGDSQTGGTHTWSAILRTTAGAFSYSPPSGFSAWDDGNIPNLAQGALNAGRLGPAVYQSNGSGALQSDQSMPATFAASADLWFGGTDYVDGTVDINGTPGSRQVWLMDKFSRRMVASMWSDPVTGYFKFDRIDPTRIYVLLGHDYTLAYNGVLQDEVKL